MRTNKRSSLVYLFTIILILCISEHHLVNCKIPSTSSLTSSLISSATRSKSSKINSFSSLPAETHPTHDIQDTIANRDAIRELYGRYLQVFHKPLSRKSDDERLNLFIHSMTTVEKFNREAKEKGAQYSLAWNEYSDMKPSEIQGRFQNLDDHLPPEAPLSPNQISSSSDATVVTGDMGNKQEAVHVYESLRRKIASALGMQMSSFYRRPYSNNNIEESLSQPTKQPSSFTYREPKNLKKRRPDYSPNIKHPTSHTHPTQTQRDDEVINWIRDFFFPPSMDSFPVHSLSRNAESVSHINWATTDNPYHRPLTGEIHYQGSCGACWAFVTASSVEAAVKLSLLSKTISNPSVPSGDDEEPESKSKPKDVKEIIKIQEEAERIPELSAQELVDCDREYNHGCNGGNPYTALNYVAENGITTEQQYPYEEGMGECRAPSNETRFYITKVKRLIPRNEIVIKQALQYGPVSVGVCGTDIPFLYYASGIFDYKDCCGVQNHAMLIVGYDHDYVTGLDYWIVQNSWGARWGENGFMRVLRKDSTGENSVCGLALNPVQASGGYFVSPNGSITSGDGIPDFLLPLYKLYLYLLDHWRVIAIVLAMLMMAVSFVFLAYGLYLDRLGSNYSQPINGGGLNSSSNHPSHRNYQTIPTHDSEVGRNGGSPVGVVLRPTVVSPSSSSTGYYQQIQ